MDTKIFSQEVQKFIKESVSKDLNSIILKGSPFESISIQELAQQIEGRQKASKKLPLWCQTENIIFPKKINLEQTSSEATALYKSKLISGKSIIDLTGGFGIDCTYFSHYFDKVYHCEINLELTEIVRHNTKVFGIQNMRILLGDSLKNLKELDKKHDWIYIDPSRRSALKEKVFLLQDCEPNIPKNMDFLFKYSDHILIKNSPLLDISSTIKELSFTKEIHVIAVKNEVKELLFVLKKGYDGPIGIKTINITNKTEEIFNFNYEQTKTSTYDYPRKFLFEPNSAILKSGAFQEISFQYKLQKLHKHTHLYTSEKLFKKFPGRSFTINAILDYDKKKLRSYLPDKKANITIRNFPESVAQIRKKTKIKEGGNIYLFFTTNIDNKKIIIICSKL